MRHRDWGMFLLRLFIGLRLIYGVQDNIRSWAKIIECSVFLRHHNFPFPLVNAVITVHVQFLAGIMIAVGLWIRYASLLLVINFAVALIVVHRFDTFGS